MSYEYTTDIRLSEEEIAELRNGFRSAGYEVVSSSGPREILIRFVDAAKRGAWNEDVILRFSDAVYVAVHSASGRDRERFLAAFGDLLRRMSHECTFVEE